MHVPGGLAPCLAAGSGQTFTCHFCHTRWPPARPGVCPQGMSHHEQGCEGCAMGTGMPCEAGVEGLGALGRGSVRGEGIVRAEVTLHGMDTKEAECQGPGREHAGHGETRGHGASSVQRGLPLS